MCIMLKKSLKNRVVVAVAISVMLIACTNQDRLPQYVITGHVDGSDGTVVYLYKYLPEYDMQTRFDSTSVEDGQFQFIGNTDRPVEAYLRLSSDSAIYSFVLTNNRITFLKTDDSYRFDGSESNRHRCCMESHESLHRQPYRQHKP